MKALSIRQPWAWAIINYGKDIENRSWPTKYRGWFLIHAAKAIDKAGYNTLNEIAGHEVHLPVFHEILTGGIVGIAKLVVCVTDSKSKWFAGPNGFVLEDVMPVDYYECRGHLGFFNIDLPVKIKKAIRDKVYTNTFEEI